MGTGKTAYILNAVVRCQVHGAVGRTPRGNVMFLHDCFEVKLILHYFLSLARTPKDLNRPGWAAQRSPHTLTLAHSHPPLVDVLD